MQPSYEREFSNWFYIGVIVGSVLYGVELFLYARTMHVLLAQEGMRKRANLFYALFSTVMLLLVTVWVVTGAVFGQKMWLANPDFPGGPYGYWQENGSVWYMDCSRVGVTILQLMTDALMIHRCRTVWNSDRIIIVPIILWAATLAFGLFIAWSNSVRPSAFPLSYATYNGIFFAYWTLTTFLNVVLTCMICYRMVRHGNRVREHLGKEHASLYFTIVTVIVESVLPLTLSSIAFLVSTGAGSATFLLFLCVYILMVCISPQMLILRVISGRACNRETFDQRASTIRFDHGARDTTATQSIRLQALQNVSYVNGNSKVETLEA